MTPEVLFYAFLGGVLPAILWLYFWLREDARCPEPKSMIVLAFITGMLAVFLVLPLEYYARGVLSGTALIVAWAVIEEVVKFFVALIVILWRRAVDESIDFVMYMITIALGFAALENALFLYSPLALGDVWGSINLGNLRFFGATLLHVLASGTIGFALAFSYQLMKKFHMSAAVVLLSTATLVGLGLAIAVHVAFNILISSEEVRGIIGALLMVWIGVVTFFILFEILQYMRYRNKPKNMCS